jgi:hypothetical protein
MSPEKLVRPPIRGGTRTPYGGAGRNFENSATAGQQAISTERFGQLLANTQQPAIRSRRPRLENDAHFVFWHSGNRAHLGKLSGGAEIGPGIR